MCKPLLCPFRQLGVHANHTRDAVDDEKANMMTECFLKMPSDASRVTQKFCQAMAMFYLSPEVNANNCVPLIAASMASGRVVTQKDQASNTTLDSLAPLLHRLRANELSLLMDFCAALAEEGCKASISAKPSKVVQLRDHVRANFSATVELMRFALNNNSPDRNTIRSKGVSLFISWTTYYDRSWGLQPEEREILLGLIRPTLLFIVESGNNETTDDTIDGEKAMNGIAELLETSPAMFNKAALQDIAALLTSPLAKQHMEDLAKNEESSNAFARLLLAYAQTNMTGLMNVEEASLTTQILEMLHLLLKCDGYAAIDDEVILDAQNFWSDFVEHVIDQQAPDEDPVYVNHVKSHIMQLLEELWAKIQFPPDQVYKSWDSDEKKQFANFRNEVRDLLQSAHTYLGIELLQAFVKIALTSLEQRDWPRLEAGLYSINGLALALNETEEEDQTMALLFNSSLYQELNNMDSTIPMHLRRTALRTLGQFGGFFERKSQNLPNALNFLFTHLEVESMSDEAARSIQSLCTACRKALTGELNAFFQQYDRFVSSPTAECFTKEKVISAIAAIAQALPMDEAKDAALSRLLDFVEHDMKRALEQMADGQSEDSRLSAIDGTQCLAGVGRAFQDPSDFIDLESAPEAQNFWSTGAGAATTQRIVTLLSLCMEILRDDGDVLEGICGVLRAGYTESAGPFVIPSDVSVKILTSASLSTPNLPVILTTACSFLSSQSQSLSKSLVPINNSAIQLLEWLGSLIQSLSNPRNDPELAQPIIDVLIRYMPRYTSILVNLQPPDLLVAVLNFTIAAVCAPEPLPKRAACNFWDAFLKLTSQPQPLQQLLDQVATHFGQVLAVALIADVGGTCSRSDIDALAPPLKKLLSRMPRSRSWFEDALFLSQDAQRAFNRDDGTGLERATDMGLGMVFRMQQADRARFLTALGVARDATSVKKVVREFWEAAREAAYNRHNAWAIPPER